MRGSGTSVARRGHPTGDKVARPHGHALAPAAAALCVLAALGTAAGCGQKGALTLPAAKPAASAPAAAPK